MENSNYHAERINKPFKGYTMGLEPWKIWVVNWTTSGWDHVSSIIIHDNMTIIEDILHMK